MLNFNSWRKKKMDLLKNYTPTSKAQLIQVCMYMNRGDVGKAQEMFDFYDKNLSLPDFEPVQPTLMQQMRGGISELYSWIKENQQDLVNGYQFVQSIIKNKGEVVPLPSEGSPLPPINE